ncbi:MAG: hypothetical protein GF405_10740, partial [Candidatus Eisenbacteria bacterium]|nr:hypothetical protein [Candidatus Eisenbacteria bacterium]
MRGSTMRALLLLGLGLLLGSCSSTVGPSSPAADGVAVRMVSGTVILPEGAAADPADLEVVSMASRAPVGADGAYSIEIPETDGTQILAVVDAAGAPVMLGSAGPDETTGVGIDAPSTALSLVLMNPYTLMFSPSDRAEIALAAQSKTDWPSVVAAAEQVVASSASSRLDGNLEPALMQLASELVIDVLDDYPAEMVSLASPWMEDAPGDDVTCVNPDPVYYAGRVTTMGGSDTLLFVVNSERNRVRVSPAWPPAVDAALASRTTLDLGDGTFEVAFFRGSFRTFDRSTGDGLASTWNAARMIAELLNLCGGVAPAPDPSQLDLSGMATGALAGRVGSGDTYGFVEGVMGLTVGASDVLAQWLWGEENEDCADYLEAVCPVIQGLSFSTEVVAGGEKRIPVVSTLVAAKPEDAQRISQLDGVMTNAGTHAPPEAAFEVDPPFATVGYPVSFDATSVTDADDPVTDLEVRWDWENDGTWDTSWNRIKTAVRMFDSRGLTEVALQVRDPRHLNDTVVHAVNVGGSEETASHVVILRDEVPWSPTVPAILDQMLEVMGITEGDGPNQYEVVGSDDLLSLDLTPGEDLVIVQSDQPQAFYNAYAASQVMLSRFVAGGGTLFWEACDLGAHGGSITDAGIELPGAVTLSHYQTWYNYVSLPGAPIVEGLPEELYGQYASHAA